MILDSATTELKAQLYADGFIESFSLYDVKHQNREEGRRGEMVQFVVFSSSRTYRDGQGNSLLSAGSQDAEARDYNKFKDRLESRMRPYLNTQARMHARTHELHQALLTVFTGILGICEASFWFGSL